MHIEKYLVTQGPLCNSRKDVRGACICMSFLKLEFLPILLTCCFNHVCFFFGGNPPFLLADMVGLLGDEIVAVVVKEVRYLLQEGVPTRTPRAKTYSTPPPNNHTCSPSPTTNNNQNKHRPKSNTAPRPIIPVTTLTSRFILQQPSHSTNSNSFS